MPARRETRPEPPSFGDALRRVLISPGAEPDDSDGGVMALARALYSKAAGGDLAAIREIVAACRLETSGGTVVIVDDISG